MKKITGNTIVGFLFAAAACVTLCISHATLKSSSAMGDPGPKMFPDAVCIAILILAVIIMAESFLTPERPFKGTLSNLEARRGCQRMLLVLSDMALFLILWRCVPFLVAGVAFMFLLCMIFKERLIFSIIYSSAVTGVLYFIFTILLKVNLNIYG